MLLERALGGSATLALAAVGFALALGEYDVGAYLWIELAFVVATVLLAVAVFSRSARRPLARTVPLLRRLRVERPIRAVYEGVHAYRAHTRLLIGVFALTLAIQAVRVLAIWCTAEAVGIGLSPRVYYVMGPLLFLVMLVPFTINGLAVREAFFVSFLGQLGVSADAAFAAGFLFFLVTIAMAVPGALILAWESIRRPRARPSAMADRSGHVQVPDPGSDTEADPGSGADTAVSVVVVTYNALPWLERCLDSVARVRDDRRRQRLDGRHGRARPRAVPGRAARSSRRTSASPPAGAAASSPRQAASSCC